MDPFTDVLGAFVDGRIAPVDVVLWLVEWAEYGADPSFICNPEAKAAGCAVAHFVSEVLARALGILTD